PSFSRVFSTTIRPIFSALAGIMPCQPRNGLMPMNSLGQNVICTASQLVPQPIRPDATGILAYFQKSGWDKRASNMKKDFSPREGEIIPPRPVTQRHIRAARTPGQAEAGA